MIWKLNCDCGKTCESAGRPLSNGLKISCGCVKIPKKKTGIDPYVAIFGSYKQNAKSKKLEFNLSKEDFISVISKNCTYCNSEPKERFYKRGRKYETVPAIVNGIDRIDSNIGYILGNVQACCTRCNRMKSDMPLRKFVSSIKEIYEALFL